MVDKFAFDTSVVYWLEIYKHATLTKFFVRGFSCDTNDVHVLKEACT